MKAYFYISIIAGLILGSCSSALYTGSAEYDDLYYLPTDEPVADSRVSPRYSSREDVLKSDQ